MSGKSDLQRADAAATLASVISATSLRVFSFSDDVVEVPSYRGLAGVDTILKSQDHSGTMLGAAVTYVNGIKHDRLIVVTDEQSHDHVPKPVAKHAYLVNVASNMNGIGYGERWTHIDGFSEGIIRFITEIERG